MRIGSDIKDPRQEIDLNIPFRPNASTSYTVKQRSFMDKLKDVNNEQVRNELDSLLEKIDDQGRILQNTMSLRDLLSYKKMVKDFMGVIVNRGYTLKEEFGWTQSGRSKSYQLLKKVDDKLEELTDVFFDKESEQVEMLGKLGEIRGLLVDMYT